MRIARAPWLLIALAGLLQSFPGRADGGLHALWELHGKRNTVYLLGSIHVLRPSDYPLAAPVLAAYGGARSVLMEINLNDTDSADAQQEMLASAQLPDGKSLPEVLGARRYARAETLARQLGVELSTFDQFAPWFVAEAISQLQLAQLGFDAQSGVEMYFVGRAQADGKEIAGLETVHDQIALFEAMSMDAQADYLLSSLEDAHDLPRQVDDMVRAWKRGDSAWFESRLRKDLGEDPALYQSMLAGRNRKWVPKIEALLNGDRDTLVIVGTAHLVGPDSLIALLKKDGIGATQR